MFFGKSLVLSRVMDAVLFSNNRTGSFTHHNVFSYSPVDHLLPATILYKWRVQEKAEFEGERTVETNECEVPGGRGVSEDGEWGMGGMPGNFQEITWTLPYRVAGWSGN